MRLTTATPTHAPEPFPRGGRMMGTATLKVQPRRRIRARVEAPRTSTETASVCAATATLSILQSSRTKAGPDPGSVTESECTSQGTVMCKEMWTMMVENYPNVPPCSSGTVDEVYTAWIEDTSP